MDAWFSSSERTASSGVRIASNIPALASKHDAYRMVSSRPWNFEIFCSSSYEIKKWGDRGWSYKLILFKAKLATLWISWVPQMNRTELNPAPYLSRMDLLYATIPSLLCKLDLFSLSWTSFICQILKTHRQSQVIIRAKVQKTCLSSGNCNGCFLRRRYYPFIFVGSRLSNVI